MNTEGKILCPCCGKRVAASHFVCHNVSTAGAAGVGKAKRRGDKAYYQALGQRGAEKRWKENDERHH